MTRTHHQVIDPGLALSNGLVRYGSLYGRPGLPVFGPWVNSPTRGLSFFFSFSFKVQLQLITYILATKKLSRDESRWREARRERQEARAQSIGKMGGESTELIQRRR